MKIDLVTPAVRSRKGNFVTADRWARILRRLGHQATIRQRYAGSCDLLVALHARKSFPSIESFRSQHPQRPLIVTLTGTDVYRDLRRSEEARLAIAWAERLVVLQPMARDALEPEMQGKTRVIRQSARPAPSPTAKARRWFDLCVVGHLRPVKDPFRAAEAARLMPPASRLRVLHAGQALSEGMEHRARSEMAENRRYRWLGDRPRWQVRRLMARSHLMVLSSRMEGGANVVSEAVVAGLPVISSRIPGSIGMLGRDHPGYFEVDDTKGLARLLWKCETDAGFLGELSERSRKLAPLYHPAEEQAAWQSLLAELL